MAYSELIKKLEKTREYVRRFYVFGFWHRDQYDMKSARSYDNERRRVESWMWDYVSSRREPSGKVVYLSVDGRGIVHNPLFHVFKAKSFTDNDITLHFYLMDILANGQPRSIGEILDLITQEYFTAFETNHVMDESTLRKKIREYEKLGLLTHVKSGNRLLYQRTEMSTELRQWQDVIGFFSEADPVGVIGSFLQDKFPYNPTFYQFKHHFLLHVLDSEVIFSLLDAMGEKEDVRVKIRISSDESREFVVHPLKIYVSTQNGRQYLLAWDDVQGRPWFYRLDNIIKADKVKANGEHGEDWYKKQYQQVKAKLWGVSLGDYQRLEHLELDIFAESYEYFIGQRLEREKRTGTVEKIGENIYRFSIDVYDAKELLPWIRTFIGRIVRFQCSNPQVREKFFQELEQLRKFYGG